MGAFDGLTAGASAAAMPFTGGASALLPLAGGALGGLFSGLGGGAGHSGMLQQQPNPWWKFYQDLYPGMLTNALGALGDPTASRLMGNPENSKMFGEAYGSGAPLGYNTGRNPMGYSNGEAGGGMQGYGGGAGGFTPTMASMPFASQDQSQGLPQGRPIGMFANGAYPIPGKRDVRAV